MAHKRNRKARSVVGRHVSNVDEVPCVHCGGNILLLKGCFGFKGKLFCDTSCFEAWYREVNYAN